DKMKKIILLFMVFLLAAGGCSTVDSGGEINMENLSEVEDRDLCHSFSKNTDNDKLRSEIKRRDLLTDRDWQVVNNQDSDIGTEMSRLGVICSLGKPDNKKEIETEDGARTQWTYSGYGDNTYIFFQDGGVVSWQ
ncbi:MAG: hypothetical protein ACQEP7_00855, partial [bacterium]